MDRPRTTLLALSATAALAALLAGVAGSADHPGALGAARARAQAHPGTAPEPAPPAGQPALADLRAVLGPHVTRDGGFRYQALRQNAEARAALGRYLAAVATADPSRWSRDEQLAFYVNAYNALTVASVLELWPVESVLAEEGFFDGRRHRVAGRTLTLNELENDVLRAPRFAEPRVHFVVNCASVSCPPLAAAPYEGASLRGALEARSRAFLRASTRLDRDRGEAHLSALFDWYGADFQRAGGVRAFVAARLPPDDAAFVRDPSTRVVFAPYDWGLNGRP